MTNIEHVIGQSVRCEVEAEKGLSTLNVLQHRATKWQRELYGSASYDEHEASEIVFPERMSCDIYFDQAVLQNKCSLSLVSGVPRTFFRGGGGVRPGILFGEATN
jgi:uncharacterized protein YfaA (DUF2138 family)